MIDDYDLIGAKILLKNLHIDGVKSCVFPPMGNITEEQLVDLYTSNKTELNSYNELTMSNWLLEKKDN